MNRTMNELNQIKDSEGYRDSVSTIDDTGKRVWVYPKKVSGWFYNARTYMSWVLLAFLFGMPFIKVNGDPLLLFNILERKFIIFGLVYDANFFFAKIVPFLHNRVPTLSLPGGGDKLPQ